MSSSVALRDAAVRISKLLVLSYIIDWILIMCVYPATRFSLSGSID